MIESPPILKAGVILFFTILYVITFIPITNRYGIISAPLVAVPVMLAGWLFGNKAGVLSGFFFILLNAVLYKIAIPNGWQVWLNTSMLGNSLILAIGLVFGNLHSILSESAQIETELRSRERYLILLKIATNNILNPKTPSDKYYDLTTHLVNLFVADHGYFLRWDKTQAQAILAASTSPFDPSSISIKLEAGQSEITDSVLKTEQALILDNKANLQDPLNITLFKNFGLSIQSVLCIPLLAREHKLGIMLLAYNTSRKFLPEEINQAEQGGQQIALALQNVQQDSEIQQRLRESSALARIMRTLSETERIGLQTVLQLIVSSAKELIPATEQAVIHLLDEEKQTLTPKAVIGYPSDNVDSNLLNIRPNTGVAGQVIVSGEAINIADISTDPRFLTSASLPSYRSLMVAAVQSGERILGTISVQSRLIGAFTEDENRLLIALGTQAAIAIENANLLENIQQTLKEVNALYRVNQGLVASIETDKLLQDTVELLQKNFGYYHVQIYIIEPDTDDIVLAEGSGEIGRALKKAGHRLYAGDGIEGYAAETGDPFFTNDVENVHFFARNPFLPDTKSELAVPVKIGGRIFGVLDIQQVPPGYLTQRDIQLVSAVADQLAVALQKAELYEDLQISLKQEKAIRNQLVQNERLAVMGRLLASVSHELNNPIQAIQNALFLLKEEKGISLQGKQDLDIVLAESERMANMIAQLRATYRPVQTEDFRMTQVNSIVEDVHTLISPHLRQNQVIFEFQPNSDLPPILAHSDQIRQVILNLFMNAVEAMADGGKLSIETKLSEDQSEVVLTVIDTGTGISPAILPNIFEAFVTDKQKGTGLGLTISYDIVTKHRGRITAQNNPERGSTFKVWLPVQSKEIK